MCQATSAPQSWPTITASATPASSSSADEVGREVLGAVALDVGRRARLAVAALVRCEYVEPGVGERLHLVAPRVGALGKPVAEDDERIAGPSGLGDVELDAVSDGDAAASDLVHATPSVGNGAAASSASSARRFVVGEPGGRARHRIDVGQDQGEHLGRRCVEQRIDRRHHSAVLARELGRRVVGDRDPAGARGRTRRTRRAHRPADRGSSAPRRRPRRDRCRGSSGTAPATGRRVVREAVTPRRAAAWRSLATWSGSTVRTPRTTPARQRSIVPQGRRDRGSPSPSTCAVNVATPICVTATGDPRRLL